MINCTLLRAGLLFLFEGSEKTEELTASVESIARSLELVIKELDAL